MLKFASSLFLNLLATYVKERLLPSTRTVAEYSVCQLILCYILIIGEWQSLEIEQLGQAENSLVGNVC